jgi:hypothetical protein
MMMIQIVDKTKPCENIRASGLTSIREKPSAAVRIVEDKSNRWIQKRPEQGPGGITLLSGWDCLSNFWGRSKSPTGGGSVVSLP